jgi:hypothetical protein
MSRKIYINVKETFLIADNLEEKYFYINKNNKLTQLKVNEDKKVYIATNTFYHLYEITNYSYYAIQLCTFENIKNKYNIHLDFDVKEKKIYYTELDEKKYIYADTLNEIYDDKEFDKVVIDYILNNNFIL